MTDSRFSAKGTEASNRPLIVVGGGVAGLEIAIALGTRRRASQDLPPVTLIDRDFAHIWKPMLHTIAAGTRDMHQQQTAYIAQARSAGFHFEPGELCRLDRSAREVHIAAVTAPDGRVLVPERRLSYGTLIIAVGSQVNDFGTPGVAEHCHSIDSRLLANAFNEEVRMRILQSLSPGNHPAGEDPLSIAIVGGGATGVELAAELIGLADAAQAYGAHGLPSRISVTLVEGGPRLLAAFPKDISSAVQERLEALGIRVLTGARVQAATPKGFVLGDGRLLPASLRVWAAGVKAPAVLALLDGLETTRTHQLVVNASLQSTRDAHVYAVGDCASLVPEGAAQALPPTAQVAHQQAQHLIRHLPSELRTGAGIPDFRFTDLGSLVSLAEYDAYGSLGKTGLLKGVTFKGRLALLSHVLLYRSHQSRLHGFWRGSLMWVMDALNEKLRATIRLD